MSPAGHSVHDPLTGPHPAGIAEWVAVVRRVAVRSWRAVLLISLIAITVPLVLLSSAASGVGAAAGIGFDLVSVAHWAPAASADAVAGACFVLLVAVAASFVASAGWAAAVWVIVNDAATGRPSAVTEALRYGFRRAAAVWQWLVLVVPLVLVGLVLFTLPGLYLIYACSLFGLVAIFEPGRNAVVRSFRLTHDLVSVAAGRVLLSLLPYAVYRVLAWVLGETTFGTVGRLGALFGPVPDATMAVLRGVVTLVDAAMHAPMVGAVAIGLTVTYAQLRGYEEPVTAADLSAALRAEPVRGDRGPAV